MKKVILFTGLLSVLMFSCEKVIQEENNSTNAELNQAIKFLEKNGFSENEIQEGVNSYLIGDDIKISKESLENMMSQSTLKQASAGMDFLVDYSNREIDIFLDQGSFNTLDVSQELNEVISAYNSVNSYLVLNTVNTAGEADIIIEQGIGDWNQDCAEASFPLNGEPGNSIIIDENIVEGASSSHNQMVFLIAHEIGHCLGFRHTNWHTSEWPGPECENCAHPDDPSETISADQIYGTPSTDNNSVYNKATCGYNWNGFSYYDKKGIQALYPALSVSVSGPSCLPKFGSATWTATGNNGNGSYTYRWIYLIRRGTQKIGGIVYSNKLTLNFQPGDSFSAGVTVYSGSETGTGGTGPGFMYACSVNP